MSAVSPSTANQRHRPEPASGAANPYGRFSPDGTEFHITDPAPPRPWVNIIANPRLGLAVSQTGSGFTWIDNSQLAVITRWQQEFAHDASGRFLYLRDIDTGETWSLAPAPTFPAYESYLCRHGIGYTVFETTCQGIAATLDAVLRRRAHDRVLARRAAEHLRQAPPAGPLQLSRVVLRRRAFAASRVPQALPRDALRRRAPRRDRHEPHVGSAQRPARSLEHALPLRECVRPRANPSPTPRGTRRPSSDAPTTPRQPGGARRRGLAAAVRPARGCDRGPAEHHQRSPPASSASAVSRSPSMRQR
jgi:hypothetical protein